MRTKKSRRKREKLFANLEKGIKKYKEYIICAVKEVQDFFPTMFFADSSTLWKGTIATTFEGKGIILDKDKDIDSKCVVVLTPEGIFSCPLVIGISNKIQVDNNDIVLAFRGVASRRLIPRNDEQDFNNLSNLYPDWAKRKSRHGLWLDYEKQVMDYLDELEKNKPF
ncbi:MAG: hypothetical protein CO137_00385 [Candidatus Magasanikbacteria bacterium CG_4_9_14_3_um_filter_32_9]|uniref:Uncharacterized protein n=1 Tax=Candidatus Magasanikbacteria bacterium CG_4_9_14_3_um_filter_32_9 TaxID=1974644 RepID=A0A2M7Z7L5_9BACT|nr:MAG: hypothetical protein CO137_00385 [Candidatus Magasanikbacteria bacterium CG_4_9_14_3_um_filter_32_9]